MTTDLTFNPCCSNCRRPMGEVSVDEFVAIVVGEGEFGLCFDCDPESADTVPGLFWQWREADEFIIDDAVFTVVLDDQYQIMIKTASHTHGCASARSCLSSSTYLHKSYPNPVSETEYDVNDAICPKCSKGEVVQFLEGGQCEKCGWQLQERESIVLPSWVVSYQAFVEGIGSHPATWCSGCENARKEGAKYCGYHHALLIEQFEDGALGRTHETL